MSKLCVSFVFLCLSVLEFVVTDGPEKLPLTVYYESKCPDSKAFINNQLVPAIRMLDKYISLQLVPFGKAKSINQGLNGFECQHGETECLGNLVQDCSLFFMKGRSDIDKVEYVSCEMTTLAGTQGLLKCINEANIQEEPVRQCIGSEEGVILQLESELLTNRVKPSFIPTVTIGDTFNQQIQDNAQEDLIGVLCSILKETPPCAEQYNKQALEYVLV